MSLKSNAAQVDSKHAATNSKIELVLNIFTIIPVQDRNNYEVFSGDHLILYLRSNKLIDCDFHWLDRATSVLILNESIIMKLQISYLLYHFVAKQINNRFQVKNTIFFINSTSLINENWFIIDGKLFYLLACVAYMFLLLAQLFSVWTNKMTKTIVKPLSTKIEFFEVQLDFEMLHVCTKVRSMQEYCWTVIM